MSGRLRLADLLGGLSIAADLGFGLPPEEAMRSCLIATALAREHGLSENEVADSFYAELLMHLGCSALSHETVAAFGDDRGVLGVVARTNVADPDDIARTLLPELTRGLSLAERARIEHSLAGESRDFGRRFDTGSCEVASATARRVGLAPGVQRALREAVEWWNGEGPPLGLRGEEISLAARIARAAGLRAGARPWSGRSIELHLGEVRSPHRGRVGAGAHAPVPLRADPRHVHRPRADGASRRHAPRAS